VGPILLFDKSTIQSLTSREARWLTHHYYSNITPILFFEIMADLKKTTARGTPEQLVAGIAKKFSPLNSAVNVHHVELYRDELVHGAIPQMEGRILVGGGKRVIDRRGRTGVFLEEPPEQQALTRWQQGNFTEVERIVAARWRDSLASVDYKADAQQFYEDIGRHHPKITNLSELLPALDIVLSGRRNRYTTLRKLFDSLAVPESLRRATLTRWKAAGGPPVAEFAPYATWCFRANVLAEMAMNYGLVRKPADANNSIDLQYFYYLPFCQVFTSNDVFHKTLAPFLLRGNQSFISGDNLKADLAKIDAHWSGISADLKATGSINYAAYPPLNPSLMTYQLWNRHMRPGWRQDAEHPIEMTPELNARIMEDLRPMMDAFEKSRRGKED
jgi:hypothetical protein